MQLVRWPGQQPPVREPSVVTLGVFDGVHRGHAEVIRQVVEAARERSWRSAIVTFDRHPAAVLSERPLPAITSLEHRLRVFEGSGVGLCVIVAFDRQVAAISARDFAARVLRDLLEARLVILGYDCRFGRGAEGDVGLCGELGQQMGFEVRSVAPVQLDGRPVSSTAIREAVREGDFGRASRLLGRPFSLYGTVVPGDGRGKALGYPTANLDLHNETIPPAGVYACFAFTNAEPIPAVASVGGRRTFHHEPAPETVVEVHLIGRRMDLYGRDLEVQFVTRLRAQRAFDSPQQLQAQMARDVADAGRALRGAEGKP
jgi:riboflavin kinase/FMN adenylyltransferase